MIAFRVLGGCAALALGLAGLSGCGGGGEETTAQPAAGPVVLDPTVPQYGKTYGEWGAAWWKWWYEMPQQGDTCVNPIDDPTGKDCAQGQSSGEVFFLAGNFGGETVRTECAAAADKAIFFPIINRAADNAGVPEANWLTEEQMKEYLRTALDDVVMAELFARVDGFEISDLGRYRTEPTKFSYELPDEPNMYSCLGVPGVTGKVDPAYAAGFWVMLAPLAAGAHTIEFGGRQVSGDQEFSLDVTYELTVE